MLQSGLLCHVRLDITLVYSLPFKKKKNKERITEDEPFFSEPRWLGLPPKLEPCPPSVTLPLEGGGGSGLGVDGDE